MILAAATDKFEIVRSSAAAIDTTVAYIDASSSTGVMSGGGREVHAYSSAATGDLLGVPAGSTLRRMKFASIRNKDASLACDVTIRMTITGPASYEIHKATLNPGDCLEYIEGVGFYVLTSAAIFDKMLYVTANSVHATAATFAAITGLNFPVIAGNRYAIFVAISAITNATTTGAQFGIGGVAMTDMVLNGISTLLGSPTSSATITTGVVTAVDTAVMAQTTGAAANQPHFMSGSFQPSASGTLSVKATSEVTVANGLTVLKGSWAWVRQTNN